MDVEIRFDEMFDEDSLNHQHFTTFLKYVKLRVVDGPRASDQKDILLQPDCHGDLLIHSLCRRLDETPLCLLNLLIVWCGNEVLRMPDSNGCLPFHLYCASELIASIYENSFVCSFQWFVVSSGDETMRETVRVLDNRGNLPIHASSLWARSNTCAEPTPNP